VGQAQKKFKMSLYRSFCHFMRDRTDVTSVGTHISFCWMEPCSSSELESLTYNPWHWRRTVEPGSLELLRDVPNASTRRANAMA